MRDVVDSEAVVIGAGAVGLAAAAELAAAGHSTLVLERHAGPGRETTSRNSQVIHAGLYYPPASSKARHCVRGNALLYEFCRRNGIAHKRLGKLVVATAESELAELERIYRRGLQNGAVDLQLIDGGAARRLEPEVTAYAALYSPSSGIVEAHEFVKALEARLAACSGQVVYRCALRNVSPTVFGFELQVEEADGSTMALRTRVLINAAGLESDRIAALAGVDDYRLHWCRGDYFAVYGSAARLVSHLIYPVPQAELRSLGVHLTLDLDGRLRLGPDATYVERDADPGDVDANKASHFAEAVQRYLPSLSLSDLHPDTWGIRPKLQGPNDTWQDFVIRREDQHGLARLINLVGIESPGLTASLSIAEEVRQLVDELC